MFSSFTRKYAGRVLAMAAVCSLTVQAQSQEFTPLESVKPDTTAAPYALLQYASLTGSGNTITATELPVITSAGATVFQNVTLQFTVSATGALTVSSFQAIPAPPPLVNSFAAGTYTGPSNTNYKITVAGPATTAGGATEWSVSTPSGTTNCTEPETATWYVGPLATSPIAARLSKAGITSTAWSYGVSSSLGCHNYWNTNTLIGVSQINNTIVFVSLTDDSGVDHSQPLDTITYTALN